MLRAPEARDRTKVEHVASVRNVRWRSEDGTFIILELTDGFSAKGNCGADTTFHPGTQYRFMGRWVNDPRWGDQFSFTSYTIHGFAGRAGVVAYLTKTCEGIGERTADRLWSKYGADTVRMIREEAAIVVQDGLLSPDVATKASEDLSAEKHLEQTRIDLFDLLQGRGFHGKLLEQAISKWGARAPETIRRDPFKLLGMAGAGFRRCDKLWRELGLPLDRLKRQLYAAINEITNDRDGHTWIPALRAAECVVDAVGEGAKPKQALRLGIRAGRLAARKDAAGEVWVALHSRAQAERRIADGIKRLCNSGACLWPDSIPVSAAEGDGLPSAHQADELRKAMLAPVGCLIGGPGTGKSHTLGFALRQIVASHGRSKVAVCSPTGKAAVRCTQAMKFAGLDLRASTIHQLLEIGRNGHDGGGWGFLRNRGCPLDQTFIIVDESSMIDAALMADLLDACGPNTHVLFVGDPFQLPPVGHGAPLRDLIASGIPTGELTEVRRNAGRIVLACRDIKAGRPVEFSPRIDLDAPEPENLRLVECPAEQVADTVIGLLSRGVKDFHATWQTQIIVALNDKGNCSRTDLNSRLQKLLNPDGIAHPKCRFRAGDKVICTRNTWLRQCQPTREAISPNEWTDATFYRDQPADCEVYCANGELGRIVAVGEKSCVARFGESDALVRIGIGRRDDGDSNGTSGDKESSMGDFDLGYAVTGHKMQGSQSPLILICIDDAAGAVACREWWYTGKSRASKLCILVGPHATFTKQVAKPTLIKRKTFLESIIKEGKS